MAFVKNGKLAHPTTAPVMQIGRRNVRQDPQTLPNQTNEAIQRQQQNAIAQGQRPTGLTEEAMLNRGHFPTIRNVPQNVPQNPPQNVPQNNPQNNRGRNRYEEAISEMEDFPPVATVEQYYGNMQSTESFLDNTDYMTVCSGLLEAKKVLASNYTAQEKTQLLAVICQVIKERATAMDRLVKKEGRRDYTWETIAQIADYNRNLFDLD